MCGIVGIVGSGEAAAPRLVEALKRLEYRGYDSAGVATLIGGAIERRRAEGKLTNLDDRLSGAPLQGETGIGHTRWATHGPPTEQNAHPHATDRVAVVHNGIIENFAELRADLSAKGHSFRTDTDTEVVAHLVTDLLDDGHQPLEAVLKAAERLEGAYALALLFKDHDGLIVAAREGSPLAVGYGEGETYLGSDAFALAPFTRRVAYLNDGDVAVLTHDGVEIRDASGTPVERAVQLSEVSAALVDKGNHRHFMAKEIWEQPDVVGHTLARYLDPAANAVRLEELDPLFAAAPRISISACGTAYYAGLVAKYWFERFTGIPVEVDIASEFRYRETALPEGGVAIFISQSGETADTLAALRYCKKQDQHVLSVVNVPESTIARESDTIVQTFAGPEIGVASTKAFTCQLSVLAALALRAAKASGTLSREDEEEHVHDLLSLPRRIGEALAQDARIEALSEALAKARDILYIGRGAAFPVALEGALKLKEISYIHAEGYAAGELKHGPIALIDDDVPVVVVAPSDGLFEKTVSNMQEVAARGGRVLLISDSEGVDRAGDGLWQTVKVPASGPLSMPMLYTVPVQLLAYHTAVHKGTDVDQPRNLAKSVTVE